MDPFNITHQHAEPADTPAAIVNEHHELISLQMSPIPANNVAYDIMTPGFISDSISADIYAPTRVVLFGNDEIFIKEA